MYYNLLLSKKMSEFNKKNKQYKQLKKKLYSGTTNNAIDSIIDNMELNTIGVNDSVFTDNNVSYNNVSYNNVSYNDVSYNDGDTFIL